jgi:glycine/D-amino acid oxidase-like deaminating enzyme
MSDPSNTYYRDESRGATSVEVVTVDHYDRIQRVLSAARAWRKLHGDDALVDQWTSLTELRDALDALDPVPRPRYTAGVGCVMEDGKVIAHTEGDSATAERLVAALNAYGVTVAGIAEDGARANYARELERVTRP